MRSLIQFNEFLLPSACDHGCIIKVGWGKGCRLEAEMNDYMSLSSRRIFISVKNDKDKKRERKKGKKKAKKAKKAKKTKKTKKMKEKKRSQCRSVTVQPARRHVPTMEP